MRKMLGGVLVAALSWPGASHPIARQRQFQASAEAPNHSATVTGALFLPLDTRQVEAVVVVLDWGLDVYNDQRWRQMAADTRVGLLLLTVVGTAKGELPVSQQVERNAAAGGGDGLLLLLRRLATQSGQEELSGIPMLFWGPSAAGSFGTTFAMWHPERTIGFVRYDSHLRGLAVQVDVIQDIPALLLAGGADEVAGTQDAKNLWQQGRTLGAPWTFGIEPAQGHGQGLDKATAFTLFWMKGVIRHRVRGKRLRQIDRATSWWGDNDTFVITRQRPSVERMTHTSWLPDEQTAKLWQDVTRPLK
jgi:hypothetical protein